MKDDNVPRWLDADSEASPELRQLLASAGADDPTSVELDGLGARLGPMLEALPTAPSAASSVPSTLGLRLRLGIGVGLLGAAGVVYTMFGKSETPTLERGLLSIPHVEVPRAVPPTIARRAVPEQPRTLAPKLPASAALVVESEIAMLERAHSALRGGRPAEALAVTQEHARAHARGKLSQEREVIAIEALVRLGRRSEADARGQAFIRIFPNSSHARRVRSILGIAGDGGS